MNMDWDFFLRMGVEQDVLVQWSVTGYSIGLKRFFSSLQAASKLYIGVFILEMSITTWSYLLHTNLVALFSTTLHSSITRTASTSSSQCGTFSSVCQTASQSYCLCKPNCTREQYQQQYSSVQQLTAVFQHWDPNAKQDCWSRHRRAQCSSETIAGRQWEWHSQK